MMMKQGIRILALNDSPFAFSDRKSRMIGIVGRRGIVEGVLSFSVSVDGDDSTMGIIRAVKRSRFADQIRVIALNGTVTAGLNAVDMAKVHKALGVQPLAITRKRPRHTLLESVARKRLGSEKSKTIRKLNDSLETYRARGYYVQRLRMSEKPSPELVELCVSLLRLAHLVASGVARGESSGRI